MYQLSFIVYVWSFWIVLVLLFRLFTLFFCFLHHKLLSFKFSCHLSLNLSYFCSLFPLHFCSLLIFHSTYFFPLSFYRRSALISLGLSLLCCFCILPPHFLFSFLLFSHFLLVILSSSTCSSAFHFWDFLLKCSLLF